MSNIVPIKTKQEESPNRLSFTLEEMLAEFENGAVPRSKYWKELITALYDTANHVVTGVTSVADVRPDNVGNIPLLPKDINAPPMVRMEGADERERQSTEDVFGRQLFYGDACKVVHQYGHYYEVLAGTGYVAGIKFSYPGMQELLIDEEDLPVSVWVDVSQQGDAISDVQVVIEIIISKAELFDFIDNSGYFHFLEKISTISSQNSTIDTRIYDSKDRYLPTLSMVSLSKNPGISRIYIGDRNNAPFKRHDNGSNYPDSVKATDAEGVIWVLDFKEILYLDWFDIQAESNITSAFLDAVSLANGKRLVINVAGMLSDTITMPDSIELEFTQPIELTGNVDHYLYSENNTLFSLINPKIKDVSLFSSRNRLHRAITASNVKLFKLNNPEIEGASTAIHANQCDEFLIDGNTVLKNIYGIEPQQGYGINTSARKNSIGPVTFDNSQITNEGHGRHALYINGSVQEFYCPLLSVNEHEGNPLNVRLSPTDEEGFITIDHLILKRVSNTVIPGYGGAINATSSEGAPPENIKITIGNVIIDEYKGAIVSVPKGGYSNFSIDTITATQHLGNESGDTTEFHQIYFNQVRNPEIGVVRFDTDLPTENTVCVEFFRCNTPKLAMINTYASDKGRAAVRFNNSIGVCIVDKIITALPVDIERLESEVIYDRSYDVEALTTELSTPSVKRKRVVRTTIESGNLEITDFLDGYQAQEILLLAVLGQTTVKHDLDKINNFDGVDVVLTPRQAVRYVKDGSRWYQVK